MLEMLKDMIVIEVPTNGRPFMRKLLPEEVFNLCSTYFPVKYPAEYQALKTTVRSVSGISLGLSFPGQLKRGTEMVIVELVNLCSIIT